MYKRNIVLFPTQPFKQIPVLRDGDVFLAQSGAMVRYLARQHDLYGDSVVEAARIDMIYEGGNDLRKVFWDATIDDWVIAASSV